MRFRGQAGVQLIWSEMSVSVKKSVEKSWTWSCVKTQTHYSAQRDRQARVKHENTSLHFTMTAMEEALQMASAFHSAAVRCSSYNPSLLSVVVNVSVISCILTPPCFLHSNHSFVLTQPTRQSPIIQSTKLSTNTTTTHITTQQTHTLL